MKATWNNEIIADSDKTVVLEGNHYFPLESVDQRFLRDSDTRTNCPWKGEASYYDIVVGDKVNSDAAWYYAEPKSAAQEIAGHIAFWRGVKVLE